MIRLTAVVIVIASLAACSGGSASLNLPRYFDALATQTTALDASYKPRANPVDPATPETWRSIEANLREFAAALDALRAPADARDGQHDLAVASRNLADDAHRAASRLGAQPDGGLTSDADRVARDRGEWERACHSLQDLALARRIDVDLRCVTALHSAAWP